MSSRRTGSSRVILGSLCLAGILQLALQVRLSFVIAYYPQTQQPAAALVHQPSTISNESPSAEASVVRHSVANTTQERDSAVPQQHKVAGLSCKQYGGPSDEIASEMVYWSDIPSDSKYISPFKTHGPKKKYLTFELDQGGWNNIRMSMETAVAMAVAMGRTLVLPPSQWMYLLDNGQQQQKNRFGFGDFFHFDSINAEHAGLEIITTQEFLEREVMTGNIRGKSGEIVFPPGNRSNYEGAGKGQSRQLDIWIRNTIAEKPLWNGDRCLVVIPEKPGPVNDTKLVDMLDQIKNSMPARERIRSFVNNATPVDAPVIDRMREQLSFRKRLCLYDDRLQEAPVLHFTGDHRSGARMLFHFYAFMFFENWKQDLWTKRFVRDHVRYVDMLQCAAARVVNGIQEKARENGSTDCGFDTFHIRRGDFQYHSVKINATEIYAQVHDVLQEGATVYIATDERDKTFFEPLRQHYKLYFLDDFMHLLKDVNTNFFGMLEQLVASKGRTFVGTYYSTFTGYINRMRGYHSQKSKDYGYKEGKLWSIHFAPSEAKFNMVHYLAMAPYLWAREWPVSWRDIDKDVEQNLS